jgi:hypothetical protein
MSKVISPVISASAPLHNDFVLSYSNSCPGKRNYDNKCPETQLSKKRSLSQVAELTRDIINDK